MSVRQFGALGAIALFVIVEVWANSVSAAESRIALVIGNSEYKQAAYLKNAAKDAEAVAEAFTKIGFKTVTLHYNLSRDALNSALQIFSREAEKSDWAVVYYAGHGIEYAGVNYVVPTDAILASDRDVQFETLPLTQILAAVEGAHMLRLVILDACRINPFVSRMKRSVASRSVGRGLARVEPGGGVLVAYAAKEGEVALDGDVGNSPFTAALIKHVQTPGLEISRLFRRVRSEVLLATNQRQEPYVYGSLSDDDFYFTPATPEKPSAVVPSPEPVDRLNGSEPVNSQPKDVVVGQAKPGSVAKTFVNPEIPTSDPGASHIKSGSNVDPAPEAPRRDGASQPATELPSPPGASVKAEERVEPENSRSSGIRIAPSQEMSRTVQTELKRVGCEPSSTDGIWNEGNISALQKFGLYAGLTLTPDNLSETVINAIKERRDRVCPLVCMKGYVANKGSCIQTVCLRHQVRNADGECIAAPRQKTLPEAVAHAGRPARLTTQPKTVEAPKPRLPSRPKHIATPTKAVTRAERPTASRTPTSRNCQVFNGQRVCD